MAETGATAAKSNATAWGEIEFLVGAQDTDPTEAAGIVRAGSFSLEVQDGQTKEWRAIGGKIIDSIQEEPTLRVSFEVKNINPSWWKSTGGVVSSFISNDHHSIKISSKVSGSEVLTLWNCTITARPVYGDDSGYGTQVTATALYSEAKKGILSISTAS